LTLWGTFPTGTFLAFLEERNAKPFFLLLIVAGGGSSLCACSNQAQVHTERQKPSIVVVQPRGEPGDFILCEDGRVLTFPVSHPKTCN
jgi:hypothetical protein